MCALKRSLLAPAPFVSALGELLSQLYDRGLPGERSGEAPGNGKKKGRQRGKKGTTLGIPPPQ